MPRWLLALALCLYCLCGAAAPTPPHSPPAPPAPPTPPLRVAVSGTWTLPFGELKQNQLVRGITFDVVTAAARRAGLRVVQVEVPQLRLDDAMAEGAFDLRCHFSPSWTPHPERYHWSEPLFETSDVLVGHRNARRLSTLKALRPGDRVGTVRGFSYPSLEPLFAAQQAQREDALDMAAVLRKLAVHRSDYAAVSRQSLDWHLRTWGDAGLAPWQLVIEKSHYHCAVPKTSKLDATRVLAGINQLRGSAALREILARYGATR